MVKIYNYSDEFNTITVEITKLSDIDTLSKLLNRLFDDVFIDWIFLFEELNERISNGIIYKKLKISKKGSKNKYIIVSVHNEETVAIIQS